VIPRDRYAPPSGHRKPDLPSPRLVVPRQRARRGAAIAVAIHAGIILALLWGGREIFGGAGDGPGPRGGGGGGGQAALHLFLLSGAGAPQAVPLPPVPQVAVSKIPLPDPVKLDLPKVPPPPTPAAPTTAPPGTGNGTTGGPGEGPGTGGGKGAGTGTGVGNDSGPGHGGGPRILIASPKFTILPPPCFRGHLIAVVSVSVEGRVTDVDLQPPPKDAECRETMLRELKANLFYPAKTLEGVPVTSVVSLQISR